jgi:putative ABC transport system permease protein
MRYAIRTLLRKPGFTIAAILALALGIGANTAIFSVVNGILLRPLPYADQERIVMIFENNAAQNRTRAPFSGADFNDLVAQARSYESLAAYSNTGYTLIDDAGAESLNAAFVSADFFNVLGTKPLLGRTFVAGEDAMTSPLQIVISHSLWQRHYRGDPNVIGRVVDAGGSKQTIIGVMPEGFEFPRKQTEVWRNMRMSPNAPRGPYQIWAMGRLKKEVSPEQAREELAAISRRLEQEHPKENGGTVFLPMSIGDFLVGDTRTPLYLLLGAVAFVLLIATANVANLLLAKSTAREKEVAIRTALGAGRGRIIRQLLTESIVLAGMGGFVGAVMAAWALDLIVALAPAQIFRIDQTHIDASVLGFTLLASVVSGILFGVFPALQATAVDLITSLKDSGRGNTGDAGRKRFRSVLIVAEVALSLILLAGAGLTIRSFMRLQQVDPGFDPSNVLAVRMSVSPMKYNDKAKVFGFYTSVMERVKTLPGVRSVALTNSLPPIQLDVSDEFSIEGKPHPAGQPAPLASVLIVTPGYFDTMGISVVRGRSFTDDDRIESPEVVMINETLARRYFGTEDPIGKRLMIGDGTRKGANWMEIVGVAHDVNYDGLETAMEPAYYMTYAQIPVTGQDLVIRTSSNPESLLNAVRAEIRSLDKDVPLGRITTLEERMSQAVGEPRFRTLLLAAFAGIALVLAALGIYGVLSYSISLRIHEFGVRMSLGASRRDVLRMVIGEGMLLTLIGAAIGVVGSLALTRVMSGMLFQVTPHDPLTFTAVSGLMLIVSFFACFIPAWRATRVDPMIALRHE